MAHTPEPTASPDTATPTADEPLLTGPVPDSEGDLSDSDQDTIYGQLDARQYLIVRRARMHNLKGVSVAIPRGQMVVVTGLSGSGKSSLAFDTIYAEGQRMYVESLSAYARQFLTRMDKPEVDYIRGLAPAIAIEQKVASRNPRSTVGTTTEIYDYLKLLFARVGVTYSPVSGEVVGKDTVDTVVEAIYHRPLGERLLILAPLTIREGRALESELQVLLQKGFARMAIDGVPHTLESLIQDPSPARVKGVALSTVIDRYVVAERTEEDTFRLSDSVQTAFYEGEGTMTLQVMGGAAYTYSDKFERDGMTFEEPSVNLFSFNNPYGACRRCEGFGKVVGIDPDLVIPDPAVSVYEGAVAPWRGPSMREEYLQPLLRHGIKFDFPIHRPYAELTEAERALLWTGNKYFMGLNGFFEYLSSQAHKIQYRVMLSRYRGKTTCPECRGSRLRRDAAYVRVGGRSIVDLVLEPVEELRAWFDALELPDYQQPIAAQLLGEIRARLGYLDEVGLGYLTLNRLSNTLSGGEYQRIKLSTSLGSALVGSLYVLDEPSIGLHPRDTARLVAVLERLRDLGNTVIVVEHEELVMRAADHLIDIGPAAGVHGGRLMFQGHLDEAGKPVADPIFIMGTRQDTGQEPDISQSATLRYLTGQAQLPARSTRRRPTRFLTLSGAREHNLQNLTVRFPLGVFTCVTGVSGSGKSTLVSRLLVPGLSRALGQPVEEAGKYEALEGVQGHLEQVEYVDQNPIGKSSRSNPVTFTKTWDLVRNLYADQPLAKQRGYKPGHYSFNLDGGRCENCLGEGQVEIEMQFMANLQLECEACRGRRFKQEVLEVTYQDRNVYEVLEMTVDEALTFFAKEPKILERLQPLQTVGLGYIKLGQSAATLSGGEAQRVKLASFLSKGATSGRVLFVFDEPTTGLHFEDIGRLLGALEALVDQGHTVVVIEHNLDMIAAADHLIDLGPEGGRGGGRVTFEGTPEELIAAPESGHTARALALHMGRR